MRVIGQENLKRFADANNEHRPHLQSWLAEVRAERWTCNREIKNRFKNALVADSDMVTFVMNRGAIRVITRVYLQHGIIRIDEVGKSVKQSTDSEKLAGKE